MTWGLSFILSLTILLMQPPIMDGKASFYSHPYIGREMRGGGIYTGQDATCAVSSDLWEQLRGTRLLVCTLGGYDCAQKCIVVTVTDTGSFGPDHIDLSESAFRALRPRGTKCDNDGVLRVRVWMMEGG